MLFKLAPFLAIIAAVGFASAIPAPQSSPVQCSLLAGEPCLAGVTLPLLCCDTGLTCAATSTATLGVLGVRLFFHPSSWKYNASQFCQ